MDQSFKDFESRKKDHIRLALDSSSQQLSKSGFGQIKLIHQALPEINFTDVSLKVQLLGHDFSSPHFISSMTAGHEDSLEINLRLARAAQKKNWLMGVGSQRRELTDDRAAAEWKKIKLEFPDLKLVSNIGIAELIQQPLDKILLLIENLGSIGIFVHLNPLQEVFQNKKEAIFAQGFKAIEILVKKSSVPVLVKEVGFGINRETTERLLLMGVKVVDVTGNGGTHWGQIEAARNHDNAVVEDAITAFHDWGQSTIDCLLDLQEQVLFHQIWASGGIRNGVDSAKCLALGARAVGVAQPLMKAAVNSEAEVIKTMELFDFQLKTAMFCMGIRKYEDFLHKKVWHVSNK
ncbi:MAG: type 2 isopentenyl-diphosphate Delta-isomerase [Bdellovibrionaceae bacterium]|nr:type 2 isopentenyl-diphosphate Delta-isomerase [Bdellovibrio sp.]